MDVLQLVAIIAVFILPGTLIAWAIDSDWSFGIRLVVGIAVSCLVVPMASFCIAWLMHSSIHQWIPLSVAGVMSVLGLGIGILRRRR